MNTPYPAAVAYDNANRRWLIFPPPRAVLAAPRPADVPKLLVEVERRTRRNACWAAGYVAYEAAPGFDPALRTHPPPPGLPVAWFALADAPRICANLAHVHALAHPRPGTAALRWRFSPGWPRYAAAIRRILRWIHAGDTYQVNHTIRAHATTRCDPWALFLHMLRGQAPGYGVYLDTGRHVVCSASPELFFTRQGNRLVSRPMKGTIPRGPHAAADRAAADTLARSPKNRAENTMIVDMVRNDLGRIAHPGSVRVSGLCTVERYPSAWQMTSTVTCRTDADLPGIFTALFPAASITGAPKVHTMELIRTVEPGPRGVYTGAAGFVAPDGRAQFNVAIRTAVLDRTTGAVEYGTGGGIVWDSDPHEEYRECRLKAAAILHRPLRFDLLETMRWEPHTGVWLLKGHLARLRAAAAYYGRPLRTDVVRIALKKAIAGLPPAPHRLRLTVDDAGRAAVTADPLPARTKAADWPPAKCAASICRIAPARTPVDPADPFLYHKTTRRNVYERARAQRPDCDDTLLWNTRGEITETCVANVAVRLGRHWYTPPIDCGVLPGVLRAELLRRGVLRERVIRLKDLSPRTPVRLLNSVRGCRPAQLVHAQLHCAPALP